MRATGFIILASISSLMGATAADHRPAIAATAQVPLSFEQVTSGNTRWTARGNGYRLAVGAADVEVGLRDEQLRIRLVGANAKAPSVGLDALPGKVNYFIGRDPKLWLRDIPTWERVRYTGVYPGVDMVWYGNQGRLEYDLELQPGADASRIALRFEGARKMALEVSGDLRVEMARGSLSLKLPEVYQDGSGGRKRIDGRYELRAGNEVGFRLAAYDESRPLVIDPTLVYATYFGSKLTVSAVAVDGTGNVYMGGYTNGGSLPVVSAVQRGILGQQNAFISKFDPTGRTVLYSTYLGGSGQDSLNGIAVDSSGSLVGTGTTLSADFPLVNAVLSTSPCMGEGEPESCDDTVFAFKLNAAGNGLVYSTYLTDGWNGWGTGQAVAVDASQNAYFTGYAAAIQTTPGALNDCCTFVMKLSNTGGEVYAAVLQADQGNAIAVDSLGAAYVAGYSAQSSFQNSPPGAQTTNAGGKDAFVAKLSPDASALVWATFLGGSGTDSANAIALGTGNVVYFGGQTQSSNLPVTAGVVQAAYGGGTDAFVANLSADGSSFGFVTYLGGSRSDTLTSLVAGSNGVIVAGNTYSRDFPVSAALQPAFPGPSDSFFKSSNSGASFTPADNGLPYSPAGAILPDPSTAGVIVVGTVQGVYRSTDDGTTWNNVEGQSSGSAARSLSDPSVLYTAEYTASQGWFYNCNLDESTSGGQTWFSPKTTMSTCPIWATESQTVAVGPTDSNTVLLFNGDTEYRSTNGGLTFKSISVPMTLLNWTTGTVVASPDGSMYAAAWHSGLYKSADAGVTWTQPGNGVLPTPLAGFALSPSNPSILYASDGSNVYKSTNAGTAWSEVGAGAGVSLLAVDPTNPQTIYGTASNALLTSTDGGATWTTTGVVDANIQGLAVNPSNAAEIYLSSSVPQSGFVAKLSNDGTKLTWSTYYGPYDSSTMGGVALAPSGDVWVAGAAKSGSLPLTPDARNGNPAGSGMAYLAEIADATAPCGYTINPQTQYSYSAGPLVFAVTAPSGCAWTATPSDTWIHLIRTSGTGSGTIPLAVDANTTASTRTGTVSVNSVVYTIMQPPSSCTYGLAGAGPTTPDGLTLGITVTAPPGCSWNVELENGDPAAVTSAATGTGSGTVTISIPPNYGADTNAYCVQIGGESFCLFEQSACTYAFPNGTTIGIPADAGQYPIQINSNLSGCGWSAWSDQSWLTLNNDSPNGSGAVNYTITLNNTGVDRTAHISIAGQQVTITQDFTTAEFADVPPSATFFDAANLMLQASVTTGCQQSSDPATRLYCPDDSVTRQEMAAFIVRAVTGTVTPAIYNTTPYFQDVTPANNNFFPHIQKLMDLGITTGCSQNPPLFCPT
ncbi:MAG: BACON domain-containing carbohydrate-binding protein, partial [Bryobacteraceae bacterium]